MNGVYEGRNDICHTCGKKVNWKLGTVYVARHNKMYHGYICPGCGIAVPEFAFAQYRRSGDVVIPDISKLERR